MEPRKSKSKHPDNKDVEEASAFMLTPARVVLSPKTNPYFIDYDLPVCMHNIHFLLYHQSYHHDNPNYNFPPFRCYLGANLDFRS
jgi:hypothetical protein